MKVKNIGEFELIKRISKLLPPLGHDVVVGVGDDVAVVELDENYYALLTCDVQIQRVHFDLNFITPYQLGKRAVAVNISDIAAKGGIPLHFLVSLALPSHTEVKWIEELYRGIAEEAAKYNVDVIGGNLSSIGGPLVVDLFLLGKVKKEHLLLRSGAEPGDSVFVTGSLGDAAAGLKILLNKELSKKIPECEKDFLVAKYLSPTPRLEIGQLIAASKKASAMIDLSDGLSSDISRICEESDVGVRIWVDKIPISEEMKKVARLIGVQDWVLALKGGEDYELCFVCSREKSCDLLKKIAQKGISVTEIGEIVHKKRGKVLVLNEKEIPLEDGWEHFKNESGDRGN